jgi:predicted membrane channel-forming protein YqfA (hemolysin III family)
MAKKIGNSIGYIGGSILIVATFISAILYGIKKPFKK